MNYIIHPSFVLVGIECIILGFLGRFWKISRSAFLYDNSHRKQDQLSWQVPLIVPRGSFTAKIGAYMHIYSLFLLRVLGLFGDAKPSAYPDKSAYNRQNKERVQYWTQVAVRYQCSPPKALCGSPTKLREKLPAMLTFSRASYLKKSTIN